MCNFRGMIRVIIGNMHCREFGIANMIPGGSRVTLDLCLFT